MKAKWITPIPASNQTSLYIFKKSFSVPNAQRFFVRISADTRYRFYLNGTELAQGPCKSTRHVRYYEELDCTAALQQEENEISIAVLHVAEERLFTTAFHLDKAALYFDGTLETGNGMLRILSDESWSVSRAEHISFPHRRYCMPTLSPFETVQGEAAYTALQCQTLYTPSMDAGCIGDWGVKERYIMQKRPIQLLREGPETSLQTVREYCGENGTYNLIFDAGVYTTAMTRFRFCAPKGTTINLIYAESLLTRAEDGSLYKGLRDNPAGEIEYGSMDCNHYDTLTATGSEQTYEPFWYRTYRFIRVECSARPEYMHIHAARYTYDFEKDATDGGIGCFECSDPKYARLWEVSRNTLECCTHETFVDCPYYEQQQYIGDGRFESLYAWKLSNDSRMQKKLIVDTAQSLQADGQIASTSPNVWVQILHISDFYFIYQIREYLRFTGDTGFVKSLIGPISGNIAYFEGIKTPEGLIDPPDGCRFIDWVSSWKDGLPEGGDKAPLTVYNLMYAAGLKDAAEICEACGYKGLAADYRGFHADLVQAINRHCFDAEAGLYADIPGGKTFSEHTGVWAILSDAITGEAAHTLAETMMHRDSIAKSSFSKVYDLLRALEKAGSYEAYAPALLQQWDDMLEKHCTSWCESLSFPRSECHGWSCIPMYEMSAMILGVSPLENGYKKVRIRPVLMDLTYAKGRVPTPYGYIDICWKLENGRFFLEIHSSRKVEMEILLPSGKAASVTADHYAIAD